MNAAKLHRRSLLKHAAAFGAAGAIAPSISHYGLASSGEVSCIMWDDELDEKLIATFEKDTGIKFVFHKIGSNEEILQKMQASKGDGYDLCAPTLLRSPQWKDLGLLAPIDYKKIDKTIKGLNPVMVKNAESQWNFGKGNTWLPHVWGTEGIAWRTDKFTPKGGIVSYGDIWAPENKGKGMGRPHSLMLTLGLWLETVGKLPANAVWDAYKSPEQMTKAWDIITKYAIDNKSQIKVLWKSGGDAQKDGLLNQGVAVGQTWDGPPLSLKNKGEPVNYRAPKEGAMAWVDGIAVSAAAKNRDGAYKFIEYLLRADLAGPAIDYHNYNSAVTGADKLANAIYAKNFAETFPGDSLAKLNAWPPEPQWYADKRTEYSNKFESA